MSMDEIASPSARNDGKIRGRRTVHPAVARTNRLRTSASSVEPLWRVFRLRLKELDEAILLRLDEQCEATADLVLDLALGASRAYTPSLERTERSFPPSPRLRRTLLCASSGASRAYTPSLERTERSFGALRRGLRPLLAGLLRRLPQFSAFGRRYIQEWKLLARPLLLGSP